MAAFRTIRPSLSVPPRISSGLRTHEERFGFTISTAWSALVLLRYSRFVQAMILRRAGAPLEWVEVPRPVAGAAEVLVEVECCAVCRTDLHVVDGELPDPKLPLIPGHQIVGREVVTGARVGIPWLGWTCRRCRFCRSERENLCDRARFTGYTRDGGYAEYVVADARYCFPIPEEYDAVEAAPLLCAGLIGYRAYRAAGAVEKLGFYGFGSAAQILVQLAAADRVEVFAFTRDGDAEGQGFALRQGAAWVGGASDPPPEALDAAIIFAPAGELVVQALRAVGKGGRVVCAGIHMSDIPSFPYSSLWGERTVTSIANLTRQDGIDFFERLKTLHIETERRAYPLERANEALGALRSGELTGTAVLEVARR